MFRIVDVAPFLFVVTCSGGALPGQDCPQAKLGDCHPLVAPEDVVEKTGMTLSEWGDAWWKWVLEIPKPTNPVTDSDGTHLLECQDPRSPVLFLPGSFGEAVQRTSSIPCGKFLFIPLLNDVEFAPEIKACDTCPGCQDFARAIIDSAELLQLEVDGCSYGGLNAQRHATRDGHCFEVDFPEDNIISLPAGLRTNCAQDGFYVLLEPLPHGKHIIRARGRQTNPAFDTFCVESELTVLCAFIRGEANLDGKVDLADAVHVLNALFADGTPLPCSDSADANDDGKVNISDAVFTLNHLFLGGAPFPPPGMEDCGVDPTEDDLDCAQSSCPLLFPCSR